MTDKPLYSTAERPGEYDALETAKPGEPIFTLQGGDPLAPATVLYWADLARTAARKETKTEAANAMFKKAGNAELVAWAMQDYQRGDNFEEQQQRLALDEITMAKDNNVVLARGCDRLHNAIGETLDFVAMPAMAAFPEEVARLREAVEILRDVAGIIEPRRHMRRPPVRAIGLHEETSR